MTENKDCCMPKRVRSSEKLLHRLIHCPVSYAGVFAQSFGTCGAYMTDRYHSHGGPTYLAQQADSSASL